MIKNMRSKTNAFQYFSDKKGQQLTGIISLIIILRFLFIFIMGPMPQDAYYFF